jgi:hypothetical protein
MSRPTAHGDSVRERLDGATGSEARPGGSEGLLDRPSPTWLSSRSTRSSFLDP